MSCRYFDLEPLEEHARLRAPGGRRADKPLTAPAMAELLGVHPNTVKKWRRDGRVSSYLADTAAGALGLNPRSVWPEWS